MKYQKAPKQLDERDKMRKFRELDDAFAQALRQLEDPSNSLGIPTGPPVRSLKEQESEDQAAQEQARDRLFAERLRTLCDESGFDDKSAYDIVNALLEYKRWQADETPALSVASF